MFPVVPWSEMSIPDRTYRLPRQVTRTLRLWVAAVEWLAFWTAALFPVAYLPLFVTVWYTSLGPGVVVGAIAVHTGALVVGHRHASMDADSSSLDRDTSDESAIHG